MNESNFLITRCANDFELFMFQVTDFSKIIGSEKSVCFIKEMDFFEFEKQGYLIDKSKKNTFGNYKATFVKPIYESKKFTSLRAAENFIKRNK